jgi:HEAT repeat protein
VRHLAELLGFPNNPAWVPDTWVNLLPKGKASDSPLYKDCKGFVDCAQDEVNTKQELAKPIWGRFQSHQARQELEYECREGAFRDANEHRLRTQTWYYFSAGMAAGYTKHVRIGDDLGTLEEWLCAFAELPVASHPYLSELGRCVAEDLPDRVERIVALLPNSKRFLFRLYLRHFLGDLLAADFLKPAHTVTVYFPTYDKDDREKGGRIYALDLFRFDANPRGLHDGPESFFIPVADDWLKVIESAHKRYEFPGAVVWNIRNVFAQNPNANVRTVSGPSHTLAACVGFRALAEDKSVDAGCLMSAMFNEGGWDQQNPALKMVGGEEPKAKAVCQWAHFTRFLIAGDSVFESGRPEFLEIGGRKLPLGRPKTLDDAFNEATGLTTAMFEYLKHAVGLLDALTPKYFDTSNGTRRTLSEMYIEPEVYKDDVKLEGPAMPDGPDKRMAKVQYELPTEEAELLRYFREQLQNRRYAWKDEWQKVRHGVIIGYPGDGKSVLARKLVHDVAKESMTLLTTGAKATTQISVPIFIRLQDVGETKSLEAALRRRLPSTTSPALMDYLVNDKDKFLESELAWVVLDGLDEVDEKHDADVKRELTRLAQGKCRVLLTSRPYRYRRADLPFSQLSEFKLAPLTEVQQRTFMEDWFHDPKRRQALEVLKRNNPSVAEMMRNALLLSLICSVAETKNLDPKTTRRSDVYRAVVEHLADGVWKEMPVGRPDPASFTAVLRRVAWQLFQFKPAAWSFDAVDRWVPAVDCAIGSKYSFKVDQYRDILRKAGLVVDTGNGTEAFLHRTFLEYLAAAHVARLPDPVAATGRFLWQPDKTTGRLKWEPAAEEFLTFVAGCMDDPTPLLKRIQEDDAKHPDALYVMARLASRCLVDLDPDQADDKALIDELLDRAEDAYGKLGRTDGVARCLAHKAGVRRLEQRLKRDGRRGLSNELIRQLGCIAATDAVIDELLHPLAHAQNELVRGWAAYTLGKLGAGAVKDTVIDALLRLLQHAHDELVRGWAARVLGQLGAGAARDTVIDALLHLLQHAHGEYVRGLAGRALGQLGAGAARDAVIDALLHLLQHAQNENVRSQAAQALVRLGAGAARERLGAGAARDKVIDALLHLLQHAHDESDRGWAAEALGQLGAGAARDTVIDALLHLLQHARYEWIRNQAAEALGQLGAGAARDTVVDALLHLLQHAQNEWVRGQAAEALETLGKGDITTKLIAALLRAGDMRTLAEKFLHYPWHIAPFDAKPSA